MATDSELDLILICSYDGLGEFRVWNLSLELRIGTAGQRFGPLYEHQGKCEATSDVVIFSHRHSENALITHSVLGEAFFLVL